jgi:hypothetical protein
LTLDRLFGMSVSRPVSSHITHVTQIQVCSPGTYCCRFEAETNDCCADEASLRTLDSPIGNPLNLPARPVTSTSPAPSETSAVSDDDDDDSTVVAVGAGLVGFPAFMATDND